MRVGVTLSAVVDLVMIFSVVTFRATGSGWRLKRGVLEMTIKALYLRCVRAAEVGDNFNLGRVAFDAVRG